MTGDPRSSRLCSNSPVEWCGGPESIEEIIARIQQREEAAVKRERAMAYAFSHQVQHERSNNCTLRAENDKIRCENIAMREALKNVNCPSCGSPPLPPPPPTPTLTSKSCEWRMLD